MDGESIKELYYMKALYVYENLDFERGGDPKKYLKIGAWQKNALKKELQDLVKRHGGFYRITNVNKDSEYNHYIRGTYNNKEYFDKSRIIRYDYRENKFFYSYQKAGAMWAMNSLEDAIEEIEQSIIDAPPRELNL